MDSLDWNSYNNYEYLLYTSYLISFVKKLFEKFCRSGRLLRSHMFGDLILPLILA